MRKKLEGIITPLVTPLLSENKLDLNGLERLIEHVIAGGVHGIFILGTTGEAQSLSFDVRVEMIKQASAFIKGRLPLLVGISDTSVGDSLRLSQKAAEYGASAVVSAPPYYFKPSQKELIRFYGQLVKSLELPLFLYNMPTHTKVNFDVETIQELAQHEQIIGFKDSSANGTYFQTVLYAMKDRQDFSIFVGPEEMTAEAVLMGAQGGVNGGANLFPSLYVDMYEAAKANDIKRVRTLQKIIMKVCFAIYSFTGFGSHYMLGLKGALSVEGICNGMTASGNKLSELQQQRVADAIKEIKSDIQLVDLQLANHYK